MGEREEKREKRTNLSAGAVLLDEGHSLFDGEHVHAVHLDAGNSSTAHSVVKVVTGGAVGGGAHAIFVVLDREHHG